jgi:hypothetical protein
MNRMLKMAAVLLFAACANPRVNGQTPSEGGPNGALASAWNERVLAIAKAEDQLLTLKGVRTLTMLHLAMHDALSAIDPVYTPYLYQGEAQHAAPTAAAAQAAYEVAVHEYPSQTPSLAAELASWLEKVPEGSGKVQGIAVGRAAAAALLEARNDDGWNAQGEYHFQPAAPGVYAPFPEHSGTPAEFVFGSGWAQAKPFLLRQPQQFRAPPPPAVDSAAYADAFNEVKSVGRFDSSTRTADQTHLALWWKDFAESSMNALGRQLVLERELSLGEATRLLGLLNASIFDSYVSVFDNKFFYNHWRPYTAIRWIQDDGNAGTVADGSWDNTHQHTYPFPSYPSAHGSVCAAALTIFAHAFGDAYPFRMTTTEVNRAGPMSPMLPLDPPDRSFKSFSEAANECALSRVYLGIHVRYDSEAGNQLGTQIGNYAWARFLAPK